MLRLWMSVALVGVSALAVVPSADACSLDLGYVPPPAPPAARDPFTWGVAAGLAVHAGFLVVDVQSAASGEPRSDVMAAGEIVLGLANSTAAVGLFLNGFDERFRCSASPTNTISSDGRFALAGAATLFGIWFFTRGLMRLQGNNRRRALPWQVLPTFTPSRTGGVLAVLGLF